MPSLPSARYGGNVGILRIGHDEASVKYEQPLFLLWCQKDLFYWVLEDETSHIHVTSRQKFHLVFVAALNVVRDLEWYTIRLSDSILEYTHSFSFEVPDCLLQLSRAGTLHKKAVTRVPLETTPTADQRQHFELSFIRFHNSLSHKLTPRSVAGPLRQRQLTTRNRKYGIF